MNKKQTANTEKDNFLKYQQHLCKELSNLKKFASSIAFLKEQNEKVVNDFFYSNLYMLYQSIFNPNVRPKIKEDIQYRWDNIKLYHYTDSPALESIISSKSLKLNNILKMNDSREGQALIEYILKNIFENQPINVENIPTVLSFADNVSAIQKFIYSFSFTTLKDDASQWDRYGMPKKRSVPEDREQTEIEKNPCGVCVEVPMKNLFKLVEAIKTDFELAEITPILYLPNNDKDNTFLKFISTLVKLKLKKEEASEFSKCVAHYSSDIKHESFQKEYEIRLLLSFIAKSCSTGIGALVPKCVDYISTEKDQYIFLKLAEKLQNFSFTDLFSSITFGPGTSAKAEKSVEKLLSKHNLSSLLHADSKHSKCTLR